MAKAKKKAAESVETPAAAETATAAIDDQGATKAQTVEGISFEGEKRFFIGIKNNGMTDPPCLAVTLAGVSVPVNTAQIETVDDGGDNWLTLGGKLKGDYRDLTADTLRAVLRALSYRRVRWFKKEDGSVRRAYVYSFQPTGGMSANVKIEDTEPLAAYVVIIPLADAVPGQRDPEKEASCLDLYPELADPMKPE